MFRELTQIILAANISGSHLPAARMEQLAIAIQKGGEFADVDPLMIEAIISHESLWRETAISKDGEDFGLMQTRGSHYGGKNSWLLNGENNIRVGSYIIKKDIEFCEKKLKRRPENEEWLALYTGSNSRCRPTKMTISISNYAQCLANSVEIGGMNYECGRIYGRPN